MAEPKPPTGTIVNDIDAPADTMMGRALQRFPWLKNLQGTGLIQAFLKGWTETGKAADGLAALRNHANYETIFAGNKTSDGRVRMSEMAWMKYRDQVTAMFNQYGIPKGFYDSPEDIGKFVAGEVSVTELQARLSDGLLAARQAPQEVKDELRRFYDLPDGPLAAFFLDPDRALDVIKSDFAKAQISGIAKVSGFGRLSKDTASRLASLGVGADAIDTFSELARSKELFGGLIGTGEDDIGRADQLNAAFGGNAKAKAKIQKRVEQRLAEFQGGGGAAVGGEGIVGLGSSSR